MLLSRKGREGGLTWMGGRLAVGWEGKEGLASGRNVIAEGKEG